VLEAVRERFVPAAIGAVAERRSPPDAALVHPFRWDRARRRRLDAAVLADYLVHLGDGLDVGPEVGQAFHGQAFHEGGDAPARRVEHAVCASGSS
jgi:hypothetical protein